MTDDVRIPATEVEACTIADIGFTPSDSAAPRFIAAINTYLSEFAKPALVEKTEGIHACLNCGKMLDGIFGSFEWGIANGEGTCSVCNWPARGYHVPLYKNKQIFDRPLEIILQYHPNYVSLREAGEASGKESE